MVNFSDLGEALIALKDADSDADAIAKFAIKSMREKGRIDANTAFALADNLRAAGRIDLHDEVLLSVPVEYLSEWRSRKNFKRIPLGSSFAAAMSQYRQFTNAMSGLQGIRRNRKLFQKRSGREFALKVGLKVAEQYQQSVKLSEISPRPGTILKPTNDSGSRGVFVFRQDGSIFDLRTKKQYDSLASVKTKLREWMKSGFLLSKRFHLEELLQGEDGGVPHDLKFYCFYGEIGLALEVRRAEQDLHCFYVAGEEAASGKYPEALFSGEGYAQEWDEIARKVSKLVPLPFLRLDFFRTNNGLYIGEFTSAPGKFEGFNLEFDRRLGQMFVEAQARLQFDLFNGKKFQEYTNFLDEGETKGEQR